MENQTVIKLNWLQLTNFKGIQTLHIDFTDETNIYGANEAGKTTISDAWHWLLTGKDSLDREKFGIKNTVRTELNRSNHEVSAEILVNGAVNTLRRVYKEDWVKAKGQLHAEYKGNSQEYFYNEVPVKAGEYQAKISAFLQESYLKMLTNPAYFNRLKWQDQRPVLTAMAGTISDAEVLDKIATVENKTAVAEITAVLNSGKTLSDYKKQLAASKKLKKEALEQIPNRIDEVTRNMPEAADYLSIEGQIQVKESAIADINILINDETAAFNLKNQENTNRQQKINAHNLEVIGLENTIRANHQRAANERGLKVNQANNNIQTVEADIKSKTLLIGSTRARITVMATDKAALLAQWHAENSKVLTYGEHVFNCPTCLRALDVADIEATKTKLADNFNEAKTKAKAVINTKGVALAAQIKEAELLVDTIEKQIVALNVQLATNQTVAADLNKPDQIADLNTLLTTDKGILEIKGKIDQLKAESVDVQPVDVEIQKATITTVRAEITELQNSLSSKQQREKSTLRIAELRAQEAELSQQIADLEGTEFCIAAYDQAKITETERRVNNLFGNDVTFKMYDFTIDGNPVDTCVAMLKGVPYTDLNTAGKVQAGLTIINALNKFYGVQAPIFLDNRESCTTIPATENQVVNLIVSPEDIAIRVTAQYLKAA